MNKYVILLIYIFEIIREKKSEFGLEFVFVSIGNSYAFVSMTCRCFDEDEAEKEGNFLCISNKGQGSKCQVRTLHNNNNIFVRGTRFCLCTTLLLFNS